MRLKHVDRPKFRELTREEIGEHGPEGYDLVQLKMDGIWGCMVIGDGQWALYSRTGKMKADGILEDDAPTEGILLGEFMHGSHWGHKMGIDGEFFVFDCLNFCGDDLVEEPYHIRRQMAETFVNAIIPHVMYSDWIHMLATYQANEWEKLWDDYVEKKAYEGLVFKDMMATYNKKGAWARLKNRVEIDYVCTGFRPATEGTKYEGQVGAVIGTLDDCDGFVTCGGLTDKQRKDYTENGDDYIGKVFTAKGNGWYPSGSVRHPMFQHWRDDKEADECIYAQIPETMR